MSETPSNAPDGPTISSGGYTPTYSVVNSTKEAQDGFNLAENRHIDKPIGTLGATAHLVKGSLGSGILNVHVAYMKSGVVAGVITTVLVCMYLAYNIWILDKSAQILYKRSGVAKMSYPEVGEAAFNCFAIEKYRKYGKQFKFMIYFLIAIELFGACTTYQMIVAKTVKQLIEDQLKQSIDAQIPGYPSMRGYMAIFLVPTIMLCLLRHLKYLSPTSIFGNFLILVVSMTTIYFGATLNPGFKNMTPIKSITGILECLGSMLFGCSCSAQAVAIESNMRDPTKFTIALLIDKYFTPLLFLAQAGQSAANCLPNGSKSKALQLIFFSSYLVIITCVGSTAFFGYAAFLESSVTPITVNFPMVISMKILKGLIACMVFVTHALNFFIPFNLTYNQYIAPKIKNKNRIVMWEYVWRTIFVVMIGLIAIAFPAVSSVMSFCGCFCLIQIAFIFPCVIELLVVWEDPGLGPGKWRMWKTVFQIIIGFFLWVIGSIITGRGVIRDVFGKKA